MKKTLIGIAIVALLGAGVYLGMKQFGASDTPQQPVASGTPLRIGFSLGALREERWMKDIELFTARAKELGATVVPLYASENSRLQVQQAENLILQGVDALVVVAHDGDASGAIVEKAHAAGIKVIAYDRMINKSTPDLYVTFDSRLIGEYEAKEITSEVPKGIYAYIGGATTDSNAFLHKEGAMRVLAPLIKSGKITLPVDSFTTDWRPEEAYKTMKAYLATGKKINAVVAANDGTAGGVIQALTESGLAGKVPVAGADADLAACQRIIKGTQTATVYTPFSQQAYAAADAAVAFAKRKNVQTNGKINNGTADILSILLKPILVTKENMDATIIKDGFHTREEVYR